VLEPLVRGHSGIVQRSEELDPDGFLREPARDQSRHPQGLPQARPQVHERQPLAVGVLPLPVRPHLAQQQLRKRLEEDLAVGQGGKVRRRHHFRRWGLASSRRGLVARRRRRVVDLGAASISGGELAAVERQLVENAF
jgi:hypothetical protein